VNDIINDENWEQTVKFPNDITNRNSMYALINFSKFRWLKIARSMTRSKWHSQLFCWCDAGISRFFPNKNASIKFNTNLVDSVITKKKIAIQGGSNEFLLILSGSKILSPNKLIGSNNNVVMGTFFILISELIDPLISEIEDVLFNEMLRKRRIDNEQPALGLIAAKNKDWFLAIPYVGYTVNPMVWGTAPMWQV
jgi:hypothetical protein